MKTKLLRKVRNVEYHFFSSKKLIGFGFILSVDPPFSEVRRLFTIDIKLFFFGFWLIAYRKKFSKQQIWP